MSDYPFHTDEIDGVERVGLLASARDERIYEFVDPDEHDRYLKGFDPRDEVPTNFDSVLNYTIAQAQGTILPMVPVPADEWAEVREQYVDGDYDDITEFIDDVLPEEGPEVDA